MLGDHNTRLPSQLDTRQDRECLVGQGYLLYRLGVAISSGHHSRT